jgi:hypothetical protein
MNGSQRQAGDTPGGFMGRSDEWSIPLEWRQEWFTSLLLVMVLAATVFLMLLSIYLVVTKPEPSSIPGDNGGRQLRQSHADSFAAVHEDFTTGGMLIYRIPAGSA